MTSPLDKPEASPWAIGDNLFHAICRALPTGSIILELGSGEGTGRLAAAGYVLYSVEHDPAYMDLYDSHYIYAPLKGGWYCPHLLATQLPKRYDALLIDGPATGASELGRLAMVPHLARFDLAVPIFLDDVNRDQELKLALTITDRCRRVLTIGNEADGRQFGAIYL